MAKTVLLCPDSEDHMSVFEAYDKILPIVTSDTSL